MSGTPWMIYGAYGYTGELLARHAVEHGERPVLAGRRAEAVAELAEELELEHRAFDLDDARSGIEGMAAVVHCAGPFSVTSEPMVEACLALGVSYLDITGEIEVFEAIAARDSEAKKAGVVLLPGVGFDVVPTDCTAARLSDAMPDATHLELAFRGTGSPSQGTLKTTIQSMSKGGAVRENGHIVWESAAARQREVTFPSGKTVTCYSIPWGDVSTAYRTTGIPNIVVYHALPPRFVRGIPIARKALKLGAVRNAAEWMVSRREPGPDEEARRTGRSEIWGRIRGPQGSMETWLSGPNGYTFTARAALVAVQRIGEVEPGSWTPARAYGAAFAGQLEGVELGPVTRLSPSS